MATIERKPLPPPGGATITITRADRAELMNSARDVIKHYMFGNGSWWDEGPQKSWDQTLSDLQAFKEAVLGLDQFVDDPDSILASINEMIEQAMGHAKDAMEKSRDVTDNIRKPLPGSNDRMEITPPGVQVGKPEPQKLSISDASTSSTGPDASSAIAPLNFSDDEFGTRTNAAAPESIRYLRSYVTGTPSASLFGTSAPTVPFVPPNDPLALAAPASFNERFGSWAPSQAGAQLGPKQPAPSSQSGGSTQTDPQNIRYLRRVDPDDIDSASQPPGANGPQQPNRPLGIVSGKPMPNYPVLPMLIFGSTRTIGRQYGRLVQPLDQTADGSVTSRRVARGLSHRVRC